VPPPVAASPAAAAAAATSAAPRAFKMGDQVEIWTTSQKAWRKGSVDKVEGTWVHISYTSVEGQTMTKIMPNGHEELRLPLTSHLAELPVPRTPFDPSWAPPSPPPRPSMGDGRSPVQQRTPVAMPPTPVGMPPQQISPVAPTSPADAVAAQRQDRLWSPCKMWTQRLSLQRLSSPSR